MKDNIIDELLREPEKLHIQADVVSYRATPPSGFLISDKEPVAGKAIPS